MTNHRRSRPKVDHNDLHAEGMITMAELSAALVALRQRSGLTQAQLSRRAGWKAPFLSRLESGRGRMPDFATLVRYGKACGASVGLVFVGPPQEGQSIIRAVTLQAQGKLRPFEYLTGHRLRSDSREDGLEGAHTYTPVSSL
jgi:transcriptional regulator with XRE-family HTH domain